MPAVVRGPWLTGAAVLFVLLAVSNLLKPLQIGGEQTGFVFFGQRLSGVANMIAGPIFGIFLAAYAAGIWGMRRFALPMGRLYLAYVMVNLLLFPYRTAPPPNAGPGWRAFGIVYALVAIGVSGATYWTLFRRREELR